MNQNDQNDSPKSDEPEKQESVNERFERLLTLVGDPYLIDFLRAFRECGVVERAARKAGIAKNTHYNWLASNETYREAFELCRINVCDQIERALAKRLIEGWDEPVYQGGELVGKKRKFDNATALRYLERISPKFKPSSEMEVNGTLENGALPIIFHLPSNGREADAGESID